MGRNLAWSPWIGLPLIAGAWPVPSARIVVIKPPELLKMTVPLIVVTWSTKTEIRFDAQCRSGTEGEGRIDRCRGTVRRDSTAGEEDRAVAE